MTAVADQPPPAARGGSTGLLQVLGVAFGLAVTIGTTIGAGILRTPGEVASRLPSTPLFLAVWLAGGLYALLGALALAEPGAMVARSGGQYAFVHRALGPYPGFVVGWSDWLSTCGTVAFLGLVFGEYFPAVIPGLAGRETMVGSLAVITFALLQWRGIRSGDLVQQVTSLAKTVVLLGLVVAVVFMPLPPAPPPPSLPVPTGAALGTAIVLALQSVIYTYDGWTGVIYFGEEVRDPGRNIPRSMIGGVLLIIALYLLLNLAFLRVIPVARMAGDPFVAGSVTTALFGDAGERVIRIIVLVSLLSTINANQMDASRVPIAMSRDGLVPSVFGRVNPGGTPTVSLLASTLVSLGFMVTGTVQTVLALLAFFFVANYVLSFTSVFVLRRREPGTPRPYRAWGYPWTTGVALLGSLAFLVGAVLGDWTNSRWSLVLLLASWPGFRLARGRTTAGVLGN